MKVEVTLRPKYSKDLSSFIESNLNKINNAIDSRDWAKFEHAFNEGINESNKLHEK